MQYLRTPSPDFAPVRSLTAILASAALFASAANSSAFADRPLSEPVVARVEMKLALDEKVVDVIEQGDLLTVLEERADDYVIVTHDGSRGAIDKVNAVRIAESGDIYNSETKHIVHGVVILAGLDVKFLSIQA